MSIKYIKKSKAKAAANIVITLTIATAGYFICGYFQLDAAYYVAVGMLSMMIEVG